MILAHHQRLLDCIMYICIYERVCICIKCSSTRTYICLFGLRTEGWLIIFCMSLREMHFVNEVGLSVRVGVCGCSEWSALAVLGA